MLYYCCKSVLLYYCLIVAYYGENLLRSPLFSTSCVLLIEKSVHPERLFSPGHNASKRLSFEVTTIITFTKRILCLSQYLNWHIISYWTYYKDRMFISYIITVEYAVSVIVSLINWLFLQLQLVHNNCFWCNGLEVRVGFQSNL